MTITRRTILKSIAASLMCPTITLRQSIPDERLLMAFCRKESYRYDFTKPFGVESLTYGSDAYALVRAELPSRVESGERRLPQNVLDVWKQYWNPQHQWRPLTPDDLIPTIANGLAICPECNDERRVSLGDTYPESLERKLALDKYGYDIDDNTVRDTACQTCHGLEYHGPSLSRVCGVRHRTYGLKRILALPNVEVCQSRSIEQALLFRADGFEGISLGMSH